MYVTAIEHNEQVPEKELNYTFIDINVKYLVKIDTVSMKQ